MVFDPSQGDGAQLLDIMQLQATLAGYSLVDPSEAAVTPGSSNLTADVAAAPSGVRLGGPAQPFDGASGVGLPSPDANDPRKALVYLDSAGNVQVAAGQPAAAEPSGAVRQQTGVPTMPIPNEDFLPLAEVWIAAGAADIDENDIASRRMPFSPSLSVQFAWVERSPMPTPRPELAATAVDGEVYAVTYDSLKRYDPATDEWESLKPIPTQRYVEAAAVDGEVYAISTDYNNDALERYDPTTDEWESLKPMPSARNRLAAASMGGKIYAAGGDSSSSASYSNDVLERYDPTTDEWESLKPMPTGRDRAGSVAVDGRLYVAGGSSDAEEFIDVLERYDPATNEWQTLASMPTPRRSFACAAMGGEIYAAGGSSPASSHEDAFEKYDPATNEWQTLASMPTPRSELAGTAISGTLYTIGGVSDSSNPANETEIHTRLPSI